MRGASLLVLGVALLGGCRATDTTPSAPQLDPAIMGERAEGGGLATLPYPSEGLVHVALFVDAGSRDGERPTTATIAAKLAARAADVHAFVGPDVIEWSLDVERAELPAAIARLSRALSLREIDAEAFTDVVREVEGQRVRALGSSERAATSLSLEALLGAEVAASLEPLGGGDGTPPATAAVAHFARAHFGAERALLVVVGDVSNDEVSRLYEEARVRWPHAAERRAERAPFAPRFGTATKVLRRASVAVTASLPSLDAARAAQAILMADSGEGRSASFAYGLRGGALLTLILDGPREREALRHAALAVLRAADLGAASSELAARPAQTPLEAARGLGLRWATRGPAGPTDVTVALGVIVPGGRADDLADEDDAPDAEAHARAEAALIESLDAVREAARPPLAALEGVSGAAELPNGARVRVIETSLGTPFGLAIAFEGAIADELSGARGRAALLVEALAIQCGRTLGVDARIEPFVDAAAVGLSLVAPERDWTTAASRALHCALSAPLDARAIEDGRIALLGRITRQPDAETMAAAARALAPSAPGAVWGLGSARSVAGLHASALPAALTKLRVGARARVTAMGPLPTEATLRFLAASLSSLPKGAAPRPLRLGTPRPGPIPLEGRERTFVAAALRLAPRTATSARAYADAYAEALAQAGLTVTFARGGGGTSGAWAVVRVEATPSSLASIAERLRGTRPSVERVAYHLDARGRAERWATASPGPRSALSLIDLEASMTEEEATAGPTAVVLVVGRSQPGEAMERLEEAAR